MQETDREWAERHLHNQDRIIDELHAKHKAALLLLKEFVGHYAEGWSQDALAWDELYQQAIKMLKEEKVTGE